MRRRSRRKFWWLRLFGGSRRHSEVAHLDTTDFFTETPDEQSPATQVSEVEEPEPEKPEQPASLGSGMTEGDLLGPLEPSGSKKQAPTDEPWGWSLA